MGAVLAVSPAAAVARLAWNATSWKEMVSPGTTTRHRSSGSPARASSTGSPFSPSRSDVCRRISADTGEAPMELKRYVATGVVTAADMERMAGQISKVYSKGDYVGSLVVPAPTDRRRPTNWTGARPAPA